jgi:uroporphyrinogen decarboxylase
MTEMTSHERFRRMFEHKEADRIPIIDGPWGATIERWIREGMPANVNYVDYFGLDRVMGFGLDNSPQFEAKVLEETDDYTVVITSWGATLKNWKHIASTPEFIDLSSRIAIVGKWRRHGWFRPMTESPGII